MDTKYVPQLGDYLYLARANSEDREFCKVIDVQHDFIAVQECVIAEYKENSVIIQHNPDGGVTVLY